MCEWRVFLERRENDDFNLWKIINVPPPSTTERRSDLYLVASNDVGVKFRGTTGNMQMLELKVRLKRKKRGAELWRKVLCKVVNIDPYKFGFSEFRDLLEKEHLLTSKHAASLQDVLAAWEREPPMRLLLTKERQQARVADVVVEQTDFIVTSSSGQRLGPPLGYRTVNLEALRGRSVYKLLSGVPLVPAVHPRVCLQGCAKHKTCNMMAGQHGDACGCVTAGFPEFVRYMCVCHPAAPVPPPAGSTSTAATTQPFEPLRSC